MDKNYLTKFAYAILLLLSSCFIEIQDSSPNQSKLSVNIFNELFLLKASQNKIIKLNSDGNIISEWSPLNIENFRSYFIQDICISGLNVYLTLYNYPNILILDRNLNYSGIVKPNIKEFSFFSSIDISSNGTIIGIEGLKKKIYYSKLNELIFFELPLLEKFARDHNIFTIKFIDDNALFLANNKQFFLTTLSGKILYSSQIFNDIKCFAVAENEITILDRSRLLDFEFYKKDLSSLKNFIEIPLQMQNGVIALTKSEIFVYFENKGEILKIKKTD